MRFIKYFLLFIVFIVSLTFAFFYGKYTVSPTKEELFHYSNMELLKNAVAKYKAQGGAYIIMDAHTKTIVESGFERFDDNKHFFSHNLSKLFMLTAGLNSSAYTEDDIIFNDSDTTEFPKKLDKDDKIRVYAELGLAFHPIDMYKAEYFLTAYLNVFSNENNLLTGSQLNTIKNAVRNNVIAGPAKQANVAGAEVAGLSSTSRMEENSDKVITQFTATFKAKGKEYGIITVMDDPQSLKETYGHKTAGWNAVQLARDIIKNYQK